MGTRRGWRTSRAAAGLVCAAAMSSGCLQTAPVVVTPQEQASRIVYDCPGGKTLDVTRLQNQSSVVLVVDGNTLRLPRDTGYAAAERYTNRLQTLTLFNNGASYEAIGRSAYGPCAIGQADGHVGGDARDRARRNKMENSD